MADLANDDDSSAMERIVADAVLEFLNAHDQGAPLDLEPWLAEFAPEVGSQIREVLKGLALLGSPGDAKNARQSTQGKEPGLADFGHYIRLEHLASGGMGSIYRGMDRVLGRQIAVKVIHQRLVNNPEMILRFQEEARVASQLQHPNIAPVHELGEIPEVPPRPYFTMKLIEGETLSVAIRAYHASPTDQAREMLLRYFIAVCNAVDYAHGRQILHRDLKPLNVMVGAYGEVQVMDWGLSKTLANRSPTPVVSSFVEPAATVGPSPGLENVEVTEDFWPQVQSVEGAARGTWSYMPPEQAKGRGVGPWSDVFGLGAILCEILTGEPPYLGPNRLVVEVLATAGELGDAYDRLERSGAPVEVVAIARHCLQKEVNDRPESAGAVARAVTDYMADRERLRQEAELAAATAQVQALEERKRRRVQVGLVATLFLLIIGALGAGLRSRYVADQAAQVLASQKAEILQRLVPSLAKARDLRAEARWADALIAARNAEVLARDDRIDSDRKLEARALVADLEHDVAEADRDNRLLTHSFDAVGIDETTLTNPSAPGQLSKYDAKLAVVFREYGVDLDTMTDAAIVARINTRPVGVRRDVASVLDLWAFGDRDARRPTSLWERLYGLARLIDPDPQRVELRTILASQQILPGVDLLLAPVTRVVTGSDHNRLLDVSRTLDLGEAPSHTIRLVSLGLITVKETDRALGLMREATQARPDDPNLQAWLGTLLVLQSPSRWREAIPVLQTLRALRRESGGVLAVSLARVGRFDEALQVCADLIRKSPKSGWPHAFRAIVLLQRRQAVEAVAAADEARKDDSAMAMASLVKTTALMRLSRFAEAEVAARDAIRLEPSSGLAQSQLAATLLARSRFAEALTALELARKLDPQQAIIHTNRAVVLTKLGRPDDGIAAANTGLRLDPENPDVLLGLASLLGERSQYDEAERHARKAVQLQPTSAEAHAVLGQILCYRKHWGDAEVECREALKLDPALVMGYSNLSACLLGQKQFPEAEAAARKAIQIDPGNSLAINNLGVVLTLAGRVAEAEPILRKSLALDPNLATIHANLASCLVEQKRLPEAEVEAKEALRLDPDSFYGHASLGLVRFKQKRYPEAELELAAALKIDPRSGFVLSNHAFVLMKLGKTAEAEIEALQAVPFDPDDGRVYYQLGDILRKMGKTSEATAACRKAVALLPNEALHHSTLGACLVAERKKWEALVSFRRAMELAPEDGDIQFLVGSQLAEARQFGEAEKALRAAIRLKSRDLAAYQVLGEMLETNGQVAESKKVFDEATHAEPDTESDCIFLGQIFNRLGDSKNEEAIYRKALTFSPRSMTAHYRLARVLRKTDREPEAVAILTKALALEPDRDSSLSALGREFVAVRQWQTAAEIFRKVIQQVGANPTRTQRQTRGNAYVGLGNSLVGLDKLEEALDAYRKAAVDLPEDDMVMIEMGNALVDLGRYQEAVPAFRKAISLTPGYAVAYSFLSDALLLSGRYFEAIETMRKLTAMEPDDSSGFFRLGLTLVEVGESAEAIKALKRSLVLNPKSSGSRALMGAACRQLGQTDEALSLLANTEDFNPRSFRALWERAALRAEAGDFARAKLDLETALSLWPKAHLMRPEVQAGLDDLNRLLPMVAKKAEILADQLPAEQPSDNLLFARIAAAQGDPMASVKFYERALSGGASGSVEFSTSSRIAAARQALRASGDPREKVADAERASLREKARRWLEEEVDRLRKTLLGPNDPPTWARVHRLARFCQSNAGFASVRDEAGLAKLNPEEKTAWEAVWKSLEATCEMAKDLTPR